MNKNKFTVKEVEVIEKLIRSKFTPNGFKAYLMLLINKQLTTTEFQCRGWNQAIVSQTMNRLEASKEVLIDKTYIPYKYSLSNECEITNKQLLYFINCIVDNKVIFSSNMYRIALGLILKGDLTQKEIVDEYKWTTSSVSRNIHKLIRTDPQIVSEYDNYGNIKYKISNTIINFDGDINKKEIINKIRLKVITLNIHGMKYELNPNTEERLNYLGQRLIDMNADIIALQEVVAGKDGKIIKYIFDNMEEEYNIYYPFSGDSNKEYKSLINVILIRKSIGSFKREVLESDYDFRNLYNLGTLTLENKTQLRIMKFTGMVKVITI